MNPQYNDDTIAAIATPPGEGGIAIVRVSGPQCFEIADSIFRCRDEKPSRRAAGTFVFGRVVSGDEVIDDALCLVMRAPKSFTGEDTVEFHGHGGTVLARRVLRATLDAGARAAEPGEFSRRSFLNGKLDLLQAEAILDAIRAKTDRAASAAVEQLEGSLSRRINLIYDQLVAVAANLEASLDFPEDELPETVIPEIVRQLEESKKDILELIGSWGEGHLLREGATVVIAGRPNAGKSTLMNALLEKDRAIVSHIPGTTRDVIEEGLVLDGIPIRLADTAGLRDADCEIEREGIRRSKTQLERADLFLYVLDASVAFHADDEKWLNELDSKRLIIVLNKSDLGRAAGQRLPKDVAIVSTSLPCCVGVDNLRRSITKKLTGYFPVTGHNAVISERHRTLLLKVRSYITEALNLAGSRHDDNIVLAATQLREALIYLGNITGRIYDSELLDRIFSSFCIGK